MSERLRGSGFATLLALVFALPLAVLALQAFADVWRAPSVLPSDLGLRGFDVAFGRAGVGGALVTSLAIAALTTLISLAAGWPAARAISRRGLRKRGVLLLGLALPLLMPPYLAGFGLTEWFIRLGLDGTLAGIVLSHVVFALPYAIVILLTAFGRELDSLEEMARSAGAGAVRRFALVTLPASRAAVGAAALLSFLVSWSQYGTTLAIGGGRPTLPIVMLPFVRTDPQLAAAIALVFLAPCVVALVFAARSQRSVL